MKSIGFCSQLESKPKVYLLILLKCDNTAKILDNIYWVPITLHSLERCYLVNRARSVFVVYTRALEMFSNLPSRGERLETFSLWVQSPSLIQHSLPLFTEKCLVAHRRSWCKEQDWSLMPCYCLYQSFFLIWSEELEDHYKNKKYSD